MRADSVRAQEVHDEEICDHFRDSAAHRFVLGQLDRHDRRCDADDSPGPSCEPMAQEQGSYRHLLYLHRRQYGRLPNPARRSSPVPGLSARRAVLLDAATHLAAAHPEHGPDHDHLCRTRPPLRQARKR